MEPQRYRRFTDELVARLDPDERVIGLVALGSMAATDHPPDRWSDHDFWIVTTDGDAAALRSDVSWLPDAHRVTVVVEETAHGRSVIYADGHLAEFAVFDDGELTVARANSFRVLLDRCDLQRRMEEIAARTAAHALDETAAALDRAGMFLTQLTIGVNRFARGEQLSANQLVRGAAARTLLRLLAAHRRARLDDLDPTRRFETEFPDLGAEVQAALDGPILDGAGVLLTIAEREPPDCFDSAAFGAVRATLSRATDHVG